MLLAQNSQAFSVDARVERAMEGGPLIVRLELTYRGDKEIEVQHIPDLNKYRIRCIAPETWAPRQLRPGLWIGMIGANPLTPKQRLYHTVYCHHHYATIPAGPAKLIIEWPIIVPQQATPDEHPWQTYACPSVVLNLVVPPAPKDAVDTYTTNLRETLERKDISEDLEQKKVREMVYSFHEPLLPLVFSLMGRRPATGDYFDLRPSTYEWSRKARRPRCGSR
jgi:hypothetical protein